MNPSDRCRIRLIARRGPYLNRRVLLEKPLWAGNFFMGTDGRQLVLLMAFDLYRNTTPSDLDFG